MGSVLPFDARVKINKHYTSCLIFCYIAIENGPVTVDLPIVLIWLVVDLPL